MNTNNHSVLNFPAVTGAIKYLVLSCILLFSASTASGQSNVDSMKMVVDKIRELIRDNYIITEKIKPLSESLAAGSYDHLSSAAFVQSVNEIFLGM